MAPDSAQSKRGRSRRISGSRPQRREEIWGERRLCWFAIKHSRGNRANGESLANKLNVHTFLRVARGGAGRISRKSAIKGTTTKCDTFTLYQKIRAHQLEGIISDLGSCCEHFPLDDHTTNLCVIYTHCCLTRLVEKTLFGGNLSLLSD